MASNRLDSPEPSGGVTGLESHLRSLMLANTTASGSESSRQGSRLAQQARPPGTVDGTHRAPTETLRERRPPSPRAGRRRLNQAQRRQMSSQLSIPINPWSQPVPPVSQPDFGQQAHSRRPPRSDQRIVYAMPHPPVLSRHADFPYGNPPWNSTLSSGPPADCLSWNSSAGQYGRQDAQPAPAPYLHHPSSTQALWYGPSPPQNQRWNQFGPGDVASQAEFLKKLCFQVISSSEIQVSEIVEKEAFRQRIEAICRDVISRHEENNAPDFLPLSVELKCFGSLSSGFATRASDLDLGLLSPLSRTQPDAAGSPIPRLLEKAFLDAGLGARLLSRTRVPIIKLCEKPPEGLRQALLAERGKWENGLEPEAREGVDDDEADEAEQGAEPQSNDADHVDSEPSDADVASLITIEVPCGKSGRPKHVQLKQGPNHTLPAYYGLARRLLRRAGGRDVTLSNQRQFTALDWTVLNRVCQAFVQGLYDPHLRKRLAAYPSLSFQSLYNMPSNRSLLGVLTQVEGEQALQVWGSWPAKEAMYDSHSQSERALLAWKDMQWMRDYGVDPVSYTKDLQAALDRIKRIPSVQLVLLEQAQHETPSQYYMRAKGILDSLRHGQGDLNGAARQEFVCRYVAGITPRDVRQMVESSEGYCGGLLGFEAVGQMHKSLYLCREFERALDQGIYDAADARDVAEYMRLLRSPLRKAPVGQLDCRLVVAVPPESADVVLRIRGLQDPHQMGPNQPRNRHRDPLEFPSTGAGVQCDINFSAHLALHNTALLRCYSLTDPRVKPMVLFVKHWAKVRGINSGYRGTLSSYGYVLMVLHYLINVVQPFVCPNLQQLAPPPPSGLLTADSTSAVWCRGYNVHFWRSEDEILRLAASNQLNHNSDDVGHLLRGFFEYFAHGGLLSDGHGKGFDWGRDVLSLRTQGGLLTKQEKGWTGARTVFEVQGTGDAQTDQAPSARPPAKGGEVKEIRHRYLFAIEDPFELEHNVARTVTHNGIVSIRDEFRRAWRIIRTARGVSTQESLLQDVREVQGISSPFLQLLDDLHGPPESWSTVE